ncbi:MAG: NUDIX hydrolase [Rhizobiales bacterium]|nr:NUDIX hydrolase [Hyphomicrobiales bacterium]
MSEPDRKALRIASTVLLLRDGSDGMEIFMVQRNRAIEFASGALVFPGGSIDPNDYEIAETLATNLPNELAAIRVAGVRETFEESGMLLARARGSDALVSAEIANKVGPLRAAVDKGEVKFSAILNEHDLVPAIDLLVPFAHWITPVNLPKRFDTHFLLTLAPKDHVGRHDGHESVGSIWLTPRTALDGAESGRFTLPFPTVRNLIKLDKLKTAKAAMDHAQTTPVVTVMPELTRNENGGSRLKIPKDAGYDGEVFDFQV